MKHLDLALLCLVFLAACSRSPYEGYTPIGEDTYFKLMAFGESEVMASDSDSVLMRVRVARLNEAPGSLFSTERWYGGGDSTNGLLHGLLGRMKEQDSASVIAKGARVPWAQLGAGDMQRWDTSMVYLEVALRDVRSPQECRALAAERAWNSRTAAQEEQEIQAFLATAGQGYGEYLGAHYLPEAGLPAQDPIQSGELVTIHYSASFLSSGKVFDDTHRSGQPLTFRLGDPGQVIKGIEVAMHMLDRQGHGVFVFPSALAFGERGSPGIVPPFTPVIYEIQVVGVERPTAALP